MLLRQGIRGMEGQGRGKPLKILFKPLLCSSQAFSYPNALGSLAVESRADIGAQKEGNSGRAACRVLLEGASVAGRRHANLPPKMDPKGRARAGTAILRYALHRVVRGLQPALSGQDPLIQYPP